MSKIQIEKGHLIREQITYREPGKKPLIILFPYFIFVQPSIGNEEYTRRFESLKQGNLASCVIRETFPGHYGRINCQALLVNRDGTKIGNNGNGSRKSPVKIERVKRYLSLEHELQTRFGNSSPSLEEIEEMQKKWRRVAVY